MTLKKLTTLLVIPLCGAGCLFLIPPQFLLGQTPDVHRGGSGVGLPPHLGLARCHGRACKHQQRAPRLYAKDNGWKCALHLYICGIRICGIRAGNDKMGRIKTKPLQREWFRHQCQCLAFNFSRFSF